MTTETFCNELPGGLSQQQIDERVDELKTLGGAVDAFTRQVGSKLFICAVQKVFTAPPASMTNGAASPPVVVEASTLSAGVTGATAPIVEAPRRSAIDVDARDTDMGKLHPEVRDRVAKVLETLAAQNVPMKVFEAYRAPERQQHLFGKGRNAAGVIINKSKVVTEAPPWHSYHQHGLAVDIVISAQGVNPWETGTDEARDWWKKYHATARDQGLEPLSFEMPHVQLRGLSTSSLLAGEYPAGGDDSWANNLSKVISGWSGAIKPPPPKATQRPPLTTLLSGTAEPNASSLDWSKLPRVTASDWGNPFGGQQWRVDDHGIYLLGIDSGERPLRSPGTPRTASAIIEIFGLAIARAAAKHGVPPELLVMTIATEAGIFREDGFTGPRTFRWEPHITDYSAGPMQILSGTARSINAAAGLGYAHEDFLPMNKEPSSPPKKLSLYRGDVAIDVGAALIRKIIDRHGTNPLLVAAAYNAGSLQASSNNLWGIRCHGNHLDRAATWYGDACEVLTLLGH